MTLRQLEYFVALAEEGSFTRAAQRLYVTQPSLSQQIRTLECELGGPLLERLPRGIHLTSAGEQFLRDARNAVEASSRAFHTAKEAMTKQAERLDIATVRSLAAGVFPSCIQTFSEERPGIDVYLHEYVHRTSLEGDVASGVGDIAFGPRPQRWTGCVVPLGWEEFLLVLPAAEAETTPPSTVDLADYANRRWVMYEPWHGFSDILKTATRAAGYEPSGAVYVAQLEAAARIAVAGVGPALVPRTNVPAELAYATRSLRRPVMRQLAAYSRDESLLPPSELFVEIVRGQQWQSPAPTVDMLLVA